jgi:hypothetical protein
VGGLQISWRRRGCAMLLLGVWEYVGVGLEFGSSPNDSQPCRKNHQIIKWKVVNILKDLT